MIQEMLTRTTVPHANPASVAPRRNPAELLSQLRLALAMAGMAAGALAYILLDTRSSDEQWHQEHPGSGASGALDPSWIVILWAVLPLVPYILSWFLLSARKVLYVAAGAGVAGGLFLFILMLSPAMCMGLLLGFGMSRTPGFGGAAISLLGLIATSIWVAKSAKAMKDLHRTAFLIGLFATVLCMSSGLQFIRHAEYQWDRQVSQQKTAAMVEQRKPAGNAQGTINSLAVCLETHHSANPSAGYPASLDPPPADWTCPTKFATDALAGFTMSYTPLTHAKNRRVTDFHLAAFPLVMDVSSRAFMVDSRGISFAEAALGTSSQYIGAFTTERRLAQIDPLKKNIESYLKDHGLAAAPDALNAEIVGTDFGFEIPTVEDNGMRLQTKVFVTRYFPPQAGDPNHFALSAQCQRYGQICLRSYFLDYDGVVHGTGEPRQATADDPPALECEQRDDPCKDVGWSINPDSP
jgi:hypothetical protein